MNSFRSFNHWSRFFLSMLILGAPLFARATPPDVDAISLRKTRYFIQTNANPVLDDFFYFSIAVEASNPLLVSNCRLRFPPASHPDLSLPFDASANNFGTNRSFSSQSAIDTAFPPGIYTVRTVTIHDGTNNVSLSLNNTYPPAPRISNFAETQNINAGLNLILQWSAFTGATGNDFISVDIDESNDDGSTGQRVFSTIDENGSSSLDGTATNVVLPARTLASGKFYYVYVVFSKVITQNTTNYPGVHAFSLQNTETDLVIATGSAPVITTHPTNKTVIAGSSATFSVSATGAALTYQWRLNGTNLAGKTSSTLAITNALPSNRGNYSVIVTSSTGYAVSASAFLTVDCGFTTSPAPAPFSSVSATGTITIQTPSTSCAWTATTTNEWITLTGATNGSGNGFVDFLVAENTSGVSRLGFIMVAGPGRLIPITQTGDFAPATLGGKTILIVATNSTDALPSSGSLLFITLPATNRFVTVPLTEQTNRDSGTYEYAKNAANHATVTLSESTTDLAFLSPVEGVFSLANSNGTQQGTFTISDTRGDFNEDGRGDILFQNTSGVLAAWLMDGTNFNGGAFLRDGIAAGPGWRAVGAADFDADGHQDLLFSHSTNRKLAVWLMDGPTLRSSVLLRSGVAVPAGWRVVGAADLSGDGSPDILLQHTNSKLAVWRFNGTNYLDAFLLRDGAAPLGWRAEALADFNRDGSIDVTFQHTDGRLAVWYLVAGNFLGSNFLQQGAVVKKVVAGWRLAGLNDFNNDGKIDLLFQHDTNRKMAVWFMDGYHLISSIFLRNGAAAAPGWTALGPK